MARASVSSYDTFLLRLLEHVHHSSVAFRPVTFRDTMHQAYVQVIRSQLPPKPVQIRPRRLRIPRPALGENRHLIPRHLLERRGRMRMASVGIGRIKEPQAVVIAI